jgi:hypothetical protein
MGFNIKEIVQSWAIASNPSEKQKILAENRYKICLDCSFYRKSRPITHDEYCSDCQCPLSRKIFSPRFDACPQHKWLEVEKEYFTNIESLKNKKTLL